MENTGTRPEVEVLAGQTDLTRGPLRGWRLSHVFKLSLDFLEIRLATFGMLHLAPNCRLLFSLGKTYMQVFGCRVSSFGDCLSIVF